MASSTTAGINTACCCGCWGGSGGGDGVMERGLAVVSTCF